MRIPVIQGVIDRRILANYRVEADVLRRLLPPPFEPIVVGRGVGIAGVCLIRLREIRPRGLPAMLGVKSENAAHRVAVAWDEDGRRREGVYIFRRDTGSCLNHLMGGKLFPGVHRLARFDVRETDDRFHIDIESSDGMAASIRASVTRELSPGSVFGRLPDASAFFERGSVGFSPGRNGATDGLELRSVGWRVEPLAVENITSSIFDGSGIVPKGAAQFDCALLMRGIHHEWHEQPAPVNCATCA